MINAKQSQKNIIINSFDLSVFLKRTHKNLILKIDEYNVSDLFRKDNFIKSFYFSRQNKKLECYDLTECAVKYIATSLTGLQGGMLREAILISEGELEKIISVIKDFDFHDMPKDRFVYIAKEELSGTYKVGISIDPIKRVKDLNVGNPEKLILVHYYLATEKGYLSEVLAHKKLRLNHIRGEWFDSNANIKLLGNKKPA